MKAQNEISGELIADHVEVAVSPLARMKGLLGRSSFPRGNGLLIQPCKGVHTFGMKFPIDVVFLNCENRVVAMKKNLPPNRISPLYFSAKSVLELPAGTLESAHIVKGNRIVIC